MFNVNFQETGLQFGHNVVSTDSIVFCLSKSVSPRHQP